MIDIVDRLKFDAVRCELQFSKGVAGNIEEAAKEIERLRSYLVRCMPGANIVEISKGQSICLYLADQSPDPGQTVGD